MNKKEDYDFRNTQWGMSKNEVLASEPDTPVVQTDSQIGYSTKIMDKNIYLAFVFKNNCLVSALYALEDMRENLEDSLRDFEGFKEILTQKYGEPNAGQGDVWADPTYGNQYELEALSFDRLKYEAALKEGKILHAALWKTGNTWVKVALSKMLEGHTCGVTVEYLSITHIENPVQTTP
jgi:hypothetical protein